MIHFLNRKNLPKDIILAFSGGADSTAGFKILKRFKHNITLAYFNHGTKHGDEAEAFVRSRYDNVVIGRYVDPNITKPYSKEGEWRKQRYIFLRSLLNGNNGVITCHHLDDVVETWIFSSIHGKPKVIPYHNNGVYRPFLLTPRIELRKHVKEGDFIEDPSNQDTNYMRNLIRKEIIPPIFKVNPGLYKVIKKKYNEQT